jgi:hypothetical protein
MMKDSRVDVSSTVHGGVNVLRSDMGLLKNKPELPLG